jgi:hypothetical protein
MKTFICSLNGEGYCFYLKGKVLFFSPVAVGGKEYAAEKAAPHLQPLVLKALNVLKGE